MRRHIFVVALAVALAFMVEGYSAQRRSKATKAEESREVSVSSLEELLPYLRRDSMIVTMTPGTYHITVDDIKAGRFSRTTEARAGQTTYGMLLVEGSGNTYNFEGVTIEVETKAQNFYEGHKYEVAELHFTGNDNTVNGLTLIDVGSLHDNPRYGLCNVVMDGRNNRAVGVEVRSRGSMPYGYGEVFGKGRYKTISHKKHSAWLVRGDNNSMKDCRIIHRSFGHHLFIQGAVGVTIEGCYIEGAVVTTEQILAEKGSGSKADKIGFKTVFGYTLPEGYTLATGEDGIRTYATGTTIIDGERLVRPTGGDIVIKDCVVKHARSGISLTEGSGTRYVENCTLIGCQDGYSIRSGGKIVNCRADAAFGPALRFVSNRDKNCDIDITITPYEGDMLSGNGSRHLAHIFGSGHNITLRKGKGLKVERDLKIAIGGDSYTIGNLAKDQNYIGSDITLRNETGYPIYVDDNATNAKITTNGEVEDDGEGSVVTEI